MSATLSAIYRYPLKSGAAQALSQITVEPKGLAYDRDWMVATPEGEYITARTHPRLLQIATIASNDGLELCAPGMPNIFAPLGAFQFNQEALVWDDHFLARSGASQVNAWLSAYLEQQVILLWIGPQSNRSVKRRPAVTTSFTDGYPLLIISEGSLHELNRRAGQEFEMLRFRPNLVIANTPAFAEDHWQQIQIGEVRIDLVKPCERCIITTLHPHTAEKLPKAEPLKTLANFRRAGDGVIFGQNAIALDHGQIAIGMPVTILKSV